MERIVMEGTPLTLEERLEHQANEIRTKEQQIEQLKAKNDHWQEVCADLHIEYGEQIEAQQQEINRLEVQVEADKDLIRELNNSYINSELNLSALISDKDEQAGRLMLLNDGIKQVIKWLTPHPSDGSRAVEKARLHLITLIGGKEDV